MQILALDRSDECISGDVGPMEPARSRFGGYLDDASARGAVVLNEDGTLAAVVSRDRVFNGIESVYENQAYH